MKMSNIPFGTTDWNEVERTEHPGETGVAYWRTRQFDNVRVRMVEYSPATWRTTGAARAISSSAWTASCTELEDGRRFVLTPGMSYQVADQAEPHRSSTPTGARLFIVD